MAVVNISLPDQMKAYIEATVRDGQFSSASEYVRDLIREDQKRRAEERYEQMVMVGLASGEPVELTDEYVAQWRAEVENKLKGAGRRVA